MGDTDKYDPLKGSAPGDEEYDGWHEKGLKLVRRTLKKRKGLPKVSRSATQNTLPEGDATGPPYDVRDVGGTGFEIGEPQDPTYDAIRVTAAGDVTVETASGDTSVIAAGSDGVFEKITVRQVIDAAVDPSDIVLYR